MKLALVTGGNRGLGFETCKQLAGRGFEVLLAARHLDDAEHAADQLGDAVNPVQLDFKARNPFCHLIEALEGRAVLDVLVNNAGTTSKGFDAQVAQDTLDVNTWGPLKLSDSLKPYLSADSAVVMVSSGMGSLDRFSESLRGRLLGASLSRAELQRMADEFVEAARRGEVEAAGFPRNAYSVSKALLNGITRVLAREWGEEGPRVNSVCPGWVRTRMGGSGATRTVEQGASGIVWAALLDRNGPTGGFFRDGKSIDW